jgi:beta propeller repeat protein
MRDKEKLYSMTLASIALFLFLILASPTASASTVQSDPLTIVETQIITHGTASNPDIYGSTIVWQDRDGNWDIYGYNLKTLKNFSSRVRWHYSPPSIYVTK